MPRRLGRNSAPGASFSAVLVLVLVLGHRESFEYENEYEQDEWPADLGTTILYSVYCGIFINSPFFNADWCATMPDTVMFSAQAIFTSGVRS